MYTEPRIFYCYDLICRQHHTVLTFSDLFSVQRRQVIGCSKPFLSYEELI